MVTCKVKASCTYLHPSLILGSITKTQTAARPAEERVGLTDPQVQLLPHIHGIAHSLVGLGQVFTGHGDGSGGDLREAGPPHLQAGLHCKQKWSPRSEPGHTALSSERAPWNEESCEASNRMSNMLSEREFIIAPR